MIAAVRKRKNAAEQGGKTRLVQVAREFGCSRRKAETLVNCMFDSIALALTRGERVELPIGALLRRRLQRAVNIQTGQSMYRMRRYPGSRRVIRFEPEPHLDLTSPEERRKQMDELVIARARTLGGQRHPSSELVQYLLGPVHAGNIDVHEVLRRLDTLIRHGRVLTDDEIRYGTYGRL